MMEELNCSVLQNEYEITAKMLPDLSEMDNKYLLVTGATGLIGSQVVKTVLCYNRIYQTHIHVVVLGRNEHKLNALYGHLLHVSELHILKADVLQTIQLEYPIHYIIHCASVTSSKMFVDKPVETIQTILTGTENIIKFGMENPLESFVYLSSLEVYGEPYKYDVEEKDYGYIDFLNARSSYSEGKRMAECMVSAYCSEFNFPSKIARLTQTIGCGIDYQDNRVFAQFAKSVIEQKNIVLNTKGRTVRSYCDICDAVVALFVILLNGKNGEAYNVANEQTAVSIAEMAQMVCDIYPESGIKVEYANQQDISKFGYNPEMKISLNTDKLQKLGWKPSIGLEQTFGKLIEGLKTKRDV